MLARGNSCTELATISRGLAGGVTDVARADGVAATVTPELRDTRTLADVALEQEAAAAAEEKEADAKRQKC